MRSNDTVRETVENISPTSSFREVKIGRTLYQVTSVFTGEKELGPTLEKLAAQHVLDDMDGRAKELLRA
jgi:hypothetical protein